MIPSKEDIIRRWFKENGHDYESEISIYQGYAIYSAMDEYAKEIAIGFYRWAITRAFQLEKPEHLSSSQLFDLYLNTLQP